MKKILLLGAGDHAKVIIDALSRLGEFRIAGLIDQPGKVGQKVLNVPIIGTDQDLARLYRRGIKYAFIAVGSIGDPRCRVKLEKLIKKAGYALPNIISLDALVSKFASLGQGNYLAPGVIINAQAVVGNNTIINTGAIIDHDCRIGDYVHLAPGVVLSGGVTVGERTHIGTGSCVSQYIKIGKDTIIGAGSVVVKNIGAKTIAYGNPCKEIRKNEK
ncbi:MAG: acetyltransferase [bacterium]|nr:acetyltransferase [bacterium]